MAEQNVYFLRHRFEAWLPWKQLKGILCGLEYAREHAHTRRHTKIVPFSCQQLYLHHNENEKMYKNDNWALVLFKKCQIIFQNVILFITVIREKVLTGFHWLCFERNSWCYP